MNGWYRITLHYAVFGIRVHDGRVVEAAPVGRWAIGKPAPSVLTYFNDKGEVERL